MRRLDELYKARRAHAPSDFLERINFWAAECALPPEVHARMHTLRIWRNASLHHDDERWAREGARDEADASAHIAELDAQLRRLGA